MKEYIDTHIHKDSSKEKQAGKSLKNATDTVSVMRYNPTPSQEQRKKF